MTITKVSYQKTYPTAPYENEKIGMEATIDEDYETVSESIEKLKKHCDEIHKKNNPQLYQEQDTPYPEVLSTVRMTFDEPLPEPEEKIPVTNLIERYLSDIEKYTDIDKLRTEWNILSRSNPKLKEAYDNKLKELTKK